MRITESISYRSLLSNLNMLNARMERASMQATSGKKLAYLRDSPADSAELLQLKNQLAELDQYEANASSAGFFLQVSESTLNSLYDLVTTIYTRGSAAASDFNDPATRSTIAAEVRSLRDQIYSLANTQVRGRYLFAGSRVTSPAFTQAGDTVTYQGDEEVNIVNINANLQLKMNIPGSEAFNPAFAGVESLLTALDSGDAAAIQSSLTGFSDVLASLGSTRAALGVDLAKLQSSELARLEQQIVIQERQSRVGDADMAEAIADINRTQTALQAATAVGSLLGKKNLFDYMA
jgi:flagellar hook-associated protein 3 FlgL